MLPELENLREMRSRRYARDKMDVALKGCVLWGILAILSWAWLLAVALGADKSLEFWWGAIVIPFSMFAYIYFEIERQYWQNTVD